MWNKLYEFTDFLWGTPLFILFAGVGLYLSFRTGFFQLVGFSTWWKKTWKEIFGKNDTGSSNDGELTPLQTFTTVLSGTVGSGNIAGVAAAIAVGGPGALFWMWAIAFVGMIIKMVEVSLAVHYREVGENNEYYGGPMYYMKKGLGKTGVFLAGVYAVGLYIITCTDACFVQVNTLASCINDVFNIPMLPIGIVVVLISFYLIQSGGVKKIGEYFSKITPIRILIYMGACAIVIIFNYQNIPSAFADIFKYAFSPAPVAGGFLGATISTAIAKGTARGIFANEAGEGTAATVHATAQTDHPIHQGMYGILEVFLDTFIICSLTGLAILTSGVITTGNTGVVLTFDAFRTTFGNLGVIIVAICVVTFAFSSYLGFYVEYRSCVEYLFGHKAIKYLKYLFFILPLVSVTMEASVIWDLADMAVGFAIIPNLIALVLLTPTFVKLFKEYVKQ